MTNVIQIKEMMNIEFAEKTINSFVKESGLNSKQTEVAYTTDTKQFIKYIIGDSELTTTQQLADSLTRENLIKYRTYLINDCGLKASTINRKFSVLKELAKYLYSFNYKVDIVMFDTLTTLKVESNSYEVLTLDEAMNIIRWIRHNEKNQAIKKYYYCLLAFDTGIRAEAINNLRKSSFIVKDNEVLIKGVDKGKKSFTKSISKEFYNDMLEELNLAELNDNDKLFNFSSQNRADMMKRAKFGLGWEYRNITFHSFKKGAVTFAYEATKDILLAQRVGSHASVVTTQRYLKDSEEIFQGGVSNKKAVDNKKLNFNNFSKEDLVNALLQCNEATQIMVKKELLKSL